MNRFIAAVTGGTLMLIAGQAQAVGAFYGIGGSLMSFDDGFDTVDPKNVFFRLGAAINEHIDIGGEISITLFPDDVAGVDFDVDTTFFFVKLNAVLNNGSKVYVMAGRADVELTGTSGGLSLSADDDDTGIGFGIQVPAGNNAYYAFDYIKYYDKDGVEAVGLNFGYVGHF